jgi:hypothetical protein
MGFKLPRRTFEDGAPSRREASTNGPEIDQQRQIGSAIKIDRMAGEEGLAAFALLSAPFGRCAIKYAAMPTPNADGGSRGRSR